MQNSLYEIAAMWSDFRIPGFSGWPVVLLLASCTFSRIIYHNFSTIDDWKIFPSRSLPATATPWKIRNEKSPQLRLPGGFTGKYQTLEELLSKNNSTAFLVLKNQNLVYEEYFNGAKADSISLAFSMSKSYFSMLLGRAIEDRLISGTQDLASKYIPELSTRGYDRVTLENLLNMSSGSNYSDSDEPIFGDAPWYYYEEALEQRALTQNITGIPGKAFSYKSADTQVLAIALKRTLQNETITDYFRRSIWDKIGAEYNASWSVDNPNGIEKIYCCLAATARDFIKLGALSLNGKNWRGEQIITREWLKRSHDYAHALDAGELRYRYQWWFPRADPTLYLAIGHLGQYTLMNPRTGVVVLRLGKSGGSLNRSEWIQIMATIAESLK